MFSDEFRFLLGLHNSHMLVAKECGKYRDIQHTLMKTLFVKMFDVMQVAKALERQVEQVDLH